MGKSQAVIGHRHAREKTHQPVVEERRDGALEQHPLLRHVACREDVLQSLAVKLRDRVQDSDEAAEQAVAIKIAGEHIDAPTVQRHAPLPVAPRLRIEPLRQKIVEDAAVRFAFRDAEKTEEGIVIGEMFERLKLQAGQRDMVGIEIDRDDALRSRGEIVQNIAPARCDGDQPVLRSEPQRFEVDDRVFPNLVVDKPLEHQGEKTLERAAFGGGRPLMRGAVEKSVSHPAVVQARGGARQEKSLREGDTMKRFGGAWNMALLLRLRRCRAVSKESQ